MLEINKSDRNFKYKKIESWTVLKKREQLISKLNFFSFTFFTKVVQQSYTASYFYTYRIKTSSLVLPSAYLYSTKIYFWIKVHDILYDVPWHQPSPFLSIDLCCWRSQILEFVKKGLIYPSVGFCPDVTHNSIHSHLSWKSPWWWR